MAGAGTSPGPKNQRPRDRFGRPLAWGSASQLVLEDYDALPLAVNHQLAASYLSRHEAFSAHEAWEAAWRQTKGTPDEEFFKGLSQIGAGYTHYLRGNPVGAVTLLTRGASRVGAYPDGHWDVDIPGLSRSAERSIAALREVERGTVLPVIEWPVAVLRRT